MKKILGLLIFLMISFSAAAQYRYASRIAPLPALPAVCDPNNGDIVYLTAGAGISPGAYGCIAANTWRPLGAIGNQFVFNQGTLTASTPFISHTATWNNAGAVFIDYFMNITDTASNAGSIFVQLNRSGAEVFRISKTGSVTSQSNIFGGGTSVIGFNGRSIVSSPADSQINLANSANSDFDRLNLGPATVDNPSIQAAPSVGGQAQGIVIIKADGNVYTFANLGAAVNGSMLYCSDCTVANPCAGGGTGAIAKRLNGAWVCN